MNSCYQEGLEGAIVIVDQKEGATVTSGGSDAHAEVVQVRDD
jgi:hypothetical protein